MNKNEIEILTLIEKTDKIFSTKEIARLTGMSLSLVRTCLNNLRREGKIECSQLESTGPTTYLYFRKSSQAGLIIAMKTSIKKQRHLIKIDTARSFREANKKIKELTEKYPETKGKYTITRRDHPDIIK